MMDSEKKRIICIMELCNTNEKIIFNIKAWSTSAAIAFIIDEYFKSTIKREIFENTFRESSIEDILNFFEAITKSRIIYYAEDGNNVITTIDEINLL